MKGILFNTQMVRALLSGRKTVTRRLVKHKNAKIIGRPSWKNNDDLGFWFNVVVDYKTGGSGATVIPISAPYKPGDILYVRETWGLASDILGGEAGPVYMADYSQSDLDDLKSKHFRWHPSIHMPKEYARIFLRVKSVHVEQLQDITEDQAEKEGFYHGPLLEGSNLMVLPRGSFASLWDQTLKNSEVDTYGWNSNPWVWVINFERCDHP